LYGRFGGLGLRHDRVREGGGLGQGLLKFLEFRGRRGSVSSLASLLAVVIGTLDVSLMEMTPCGPGIFKIK
jgi:hypothetical protein